MEPSTVELGDELLAAERLMRSAPPAVTAEAAEAFTTRHYGRAVTATALSGERDRNFLVADGAGWSAVLKFYNAADDAETRALQNGTLAHLQARHAACPVPAIIPPLQGGQEVVATIDDQSVAAVMISRLPGVNPQAADLSPGLRADVGRVVGALSLALADYRHPGARRAILWDLMLLAGLRPLTRFIADPPSRQSVADWIDHFEAEVLPAARRLPHQPIHNDLSLSNLLVDPARRDHVLGVIDFGDIVHAPRINEFAIAASYFTAATEDPAVAVAQLIGGIGPDLRLERDEVLLLPALLRARLAVRILLSGWRAQLFPENRTYILRSSQAAWALWHRLAAEDSKALAERIATLSAGVWE